MLKDLSSTKLKSSNTSLYIYIYIYSVFNKSSQVRSYFFDHNCNIIIRLGYQWNEECIASKFNKCGVFVNWSL
jgi:hypothetical protein